MQSEMTVAKHLLTFLLAAMVPLAAHTQSPHVDFVPEVVFAGRSEGKGELTLLMGRARPFTVESVGTLQGDGALVLRQQIHFEGKPVETRAWVMRRTGPGTFAATLTDAAGPVSARTAGNRMTLRYPLTRWGLSMHQTLDLAGDGRSIANRGSVRFLGVPMGELRETILLGR